MQQITHLVNQFDFIWPLTECIHVYDLYLEEMCFLSTFNARYTSEVNIHIVFERLFYTFLVTFFTNHIFKSTFFMGEMCDFDYCSDYFT